MRRLSVVPSGPMAIVHALTIGCGVGGEGDSAAPPPRRTVFVSSALYTGALGGLTGADSKCQVLADAAGLDGTFKAWLSDSTVQAVARLTHSADAYVRPDGVHIASSWADLVDGTIQNPINVDERGQVVPGAAWVELEGDVWTGTTDSGAALPTHCKDWTGTGTPTELPGGGYFFGDDNFGRTGSTAKTSDWSGGSYNFSCTTQEMRIFCFQQ
jgi:Protein of unknown function (DUF1554)